MTNKTNKELYAELASKLQEVDSKLEEIKQFAEENKLTFSILGATYIPKSNKVRLEFSEEMEPTEDIEPNEDYGFWPKTDRGTLWIPSNCW